MPTKIDGVEQPAWTAFQVKSGQTLSFGFLKSGARTYIAISGGIDVPARAGLALPIRSARSAASRAAP